MPRHQDGPVSREPSRGSSCASCPRWSGVPDKARGGEDDPGQFRVHDVAVGAARRSTASHDAGSVDVERSSRLEPVGRRGPAGWIGSSLALTPCAPSAPMPPQRNSAPLAAAESSPGGQRRQRVELARRRRRVRRSRRPAGRRPGEHPCERALAVGVERQRIGEGEVREGALQQRHRLDRRRIEAGRQAGERERDQPGAEAVTDEVDTQVPGLRRAAARAAGPSPCFPTTPARFFICQ